jgi:hypothetical protein
MAGTCDEELTRNRRAQGSTRTPGGRRRLNGTQPRLRAASPSIERGARVAQWQFCPHAQIRSMMHRVSSLSATDTNRGSVVLARDLADFCFCPNTPTLHIDFLVGRRTCSACPSAHRPSRAWASAKRRVSANRHDSAKAHVGLNPYRVPPPLRGRIEPRLPTDVCQPRTRHSCFLGHL